MRIHGPTGPGLAPSAATPRRAAAGAFSLGDAEHAKAAGAPASLRSIGGIDALIALQGIEEPAERRRRAVKRGRNALDVLDHLKLDLLSGEFDYATVNRLKAAAADLKDSSGDGDLDRVLAEIELRVEVELAKAGIRVQELRLGA
jgi:hypothetical protein